MSDATPLIVPLMVEAFVVNDPVRLSGRPFMRAQMQYNALQQCANGQATLNGNDSAFTRPNVVPPHNIPASDYYDGVYLKWRLPKAFTQGAHDPQSGTTTYPPVPNRWLIVRLSGPPASRQAAAWIVESDYVWAAAPSAQDVSGTASMYVASSGGSPVGVFIGRNVALGSWTESGASLHLTAVAPGNPAFAAYQPHNNNVFSFVDVLGDGADDTLSYQVLGWYSDAADDPLAGVDAQQFAATLAALNWVLPEGTEPGLNAQMTLLAGSVGGVQWQTSALPPGGAPGQAAPVSIAVGNKSVEALTALVATQAAAAGDAIDADLLEAFQLGLLDVLDQPDGAAILANRLQAAFFQRYSGGYTWTIVDAPGAQPPLPPSELANEQAWLQLLSQNQAQLDAALRQLGGLQTQLYVAWWKYVSWPFDFTGSTSLPGLGDQTQLQNAIDPSVQGSIAQQAAAQLATVQALAAQVPDGATPEALQAAIDAYAAAQGLPASRVLKRGAAAPYYLPNNPVVLISGAGASGIVEQQGTALCRFASQLVTGFTFDGETITVATPGLAIPQPDLAGLAGAPWSEALVTGLVQESFFLDPANAAMVAAAIAGSSVSAVQAAMSDAANDVGTYPAGAVQQWTRNPWHPLLLWWQASYYPIAYGSTEAPNWTFQDGRYVWNGSAASVEQRTSLSGMVQLSPTASSNMKARIQAFLQNNPSLDPAETAELDDLLAFVQESDNWDLLSQSLDGFNEQLRLGMPGVFLSPASSSLQTDPPLATLIGDAATYPPALPPIPTGRISASAFQPWRSGQFVFTNLLLVDEWGQALWPIDPASQSTETVYLPADMMPVIVSNSLPFAITADGSAPPPAAATGPGPAITSLSPDLIQAGMATSALVSVTIAGSGFGADSVAQWNGVALSATLVDDGQIVADVPANFVAEPGVYPVTVTSGGVASAAADFTVSAGAAIGQLSPASAAPGAPAFTLTATGVGFQPQSSLQWNGFPLATTFVSDTELTAEVTADLVAAAGTASVTEAFGHLVVPLATASYVQLPPALLQPARLNFDLLSATDDQVKFGPLAPTADPICGWVLPNHLDASLMAYDAQGSALGEMSVGISAGDQPAVFWMPAPGSPYASLEQVAAAIPHFGPFLLALSQQAPTTFTAFMQAIDETLWTTVPMGAVFDQSLAVIMGRPLAMVRAQLQFELDGPPYADPSWQFTFAPASPAIESYEFPIELGNLGQIEDGLIGYFREDDYSRFNVVAQAGAAPNSYLDPIGSDGNYISLPFDGSSACQVSMLIDPRAGVHATTAILPVVALSLPPSLVSDALAAMNVNFRVRGALTDQIVSASGAIRILMPVPKEKSGAWSWVENDAGTWTPYETGPNDAAARLSTVPPVLRTGLLQLSSALGGGAQNPPPPPPAPPPPSPPEPDPG